MAQGSGRIAERVLEGRRAFGRSESRQFAGSGEQDRGFHIQKER